jgi:ubiquinol-cytochrome c reductase core subunit 2
MLIKHATPRVLAVARQQRHHLSSSTLSIVCRGYASVAATKASSPATPFTLSEVGGIQVATKDDGGPTTGLSVVLRAGARYAPMPGLAHLLDKFAWKVDHL